jgi:hypothetical protein
LFCGFHAGMRKLEIVEAVPEWFNLLGRTVEIRADRNLSTEGSRRADLFH